MRYRLVILDFDGTLADSFPWFLQNVNGVADKFGFRPVDENDIERLRAMPPHEILKALQVRRWKLHMIARHMRQLKAADLAAISLFPGAGDLLQTLNAKNIVTAIVSSDNESNVRRVLGPDNAALIAHYACGASLFGKAAKFRRVLRKSGIPASHAFCIGDEIRDLEAARAVGIAFGAVTWGYARADALRARKPDAMFTSMTDIINAL